MSVLWSDELRLLYTLVLNVLVLWASWRLARRFNRDRLSAAGDAGLLYFLVQYVSVCGTGIVGALHPLTIALVALLASSAMAAVGGRSRSARGDEPSAPAQPFRDSRERSSVIDYANASQPHALHWIRMRGSLAIVSTAVFFVIAYLATLIWHQRLLPVMANDALTYHLPAAVQWLRDGRLSFYEAWFYNPANSYSPLAGSAFLAWLIAPMGNDVVARFVQVAPALLLMIAMLNLCRALGAAVAAAALLAAACVLARPFMSQTILAKDDLFVAAFFIPLLDALRRERLNDAPGPCRAGIALGLLLATKFTVLFSVPILLLMLHRQRAGRAVDEENRDDPFSQDRRAKKGIIPAFWRRPLVVFAVAFVLAGPWYLRNLRLTGNPLFPTEVKVFGVTLLPGMLEVGRSKLLKTPRGAWNVFTDGYYAIPPAVAVILTIGWIAAWVVGRRDALRDRLKRTCLIGPMIGIVLFVAAAPYGEMRFAYPAIALLFAAVAIVLGVLPFAAQISVAGAMMMLCALTAFVPSKSAAFTVAGAIAGAAGAGVALLRPSRPVVALGGVAALVVLGMGVYVNWSAYVEQTRLDGPPVWSEPTVYGPVGEVWAYVRNELPRDAVIAYANTYFTYPLMGFAYDHRVAYAPTRRGLERFIDMPRIDQRMTGEQITGHIVRMLREDPDRDAWLRRLRETRAAFLVVMKQDPAAPGRTVVSPEAVFAAEEPQRFVVVFDNAAGTVYRINW